MSGTTHKFAPKVPAGGTYGAGSQGGSSISLGSDGFYCQEDRMLGAYSERVGKEGRGGQRQACWRPTKMADRLKALERENRELLRKTSTYFAQAELDRPFKR